MEIVDVQNIELVIGKGGAARQRQYGRGQQTELKRFRHPVLLVLSAALEPDPVCRIPVPQASPSLHGRCFHQPLVAAREKPVTARVHSKSGKQKKLPRGELFRSTI
jgi:hypothetical protein